MKLSAVPPISSDAPWRWACPLAAGAVAVVWLTDFPLTAWPLALLLAGASAMVAWRPVLLLALVPASLPVLDLAPWSGRRFVDEFDVLLLLLWTVAWARLPAGAPPPPRRAESLAWAVFVVALAIGTARALSPWPVADSVDPGNPLSPLNALRLAKGAVAAWGLWAVARRLQAAGEPVGQAFGWGMAAGLAGTVVAIVIERLAFTYLLDFGSTYRISGPFSVMSLGGAYVECFLAVAIPFLIARLLPPAPAWRLAAGGALLAGAAYALMVTFSRGGYGAMAVGVLVMLGASLLGRHQRWQRLAVVLALASLAAAVSYPVLMGSFAQARIQTVAADLGTREQHWAESLRVVGNDPTVQLLGVGLGRFAEANFWASPEGERAGGHRLVPDGSDGQGLRLGTGFAYFIDQIVPVEPGARYQLSYRIRLDGPRGALGTGLCQKWIIASMSCGHAKKSGAQAPAATMAVGEWQTVRAEITAPDAGPGKLPRPVRLSLNNGGRAPLVVDQVSLVAPDGRDLLRNGGFETGMDHWTFTSDHHLAWHTKSMLIGVYVELGMLGVAGVLALMLVGAWRAGESAWRGQPDGMAMLAAQSAFVTVGFIDTLVDAPRFLMLWLLLCLLPSALPSTPPPTLSHPPGRRRLS